MAPTRRGDMVPILQAGPRGYYGPEPIRFNFRFHAVFAKKILNYKFLIPSEFSSTTEFIIILMR